VKTITSVSKSARVMTVVAVAAAGIAACGSSSTQSTSSSSSSVSSSSPASTVAAGSPISVPLTGQPSGTASLNWDPQTKNVTAKLQMVGFTPGSSHAMHIHQGSCQAQGNVLVAFPNVTADDKGAINTTVTSSQPYPSGLAPGTLLNIHLAPADQLGSPDSLGYTPISCADINPAASTTLTMVPLPQPGQHPQGSATLAYDPAKKTLSVTATASGLPPGTAHAIHIHLGTCDSQGAVKYPLNDLVASPAGTADSTTVIQNVDQAPPKSGWYINVHLGSSSQIEQNGQPTLYFQPIICGNVGK
jgi:Cu/Zn superoxide dismutase